MPRPKRKERIPFGAKRMKLAPKDKLPENMFYHWFNATGTKIEDAQDSGYSFVDGDHVPLEDGQDDTMGKALRKRVDTNERGEPIYAYLMAKRRDWYEEDFGKKQAEIDQREKEILFGRGTEIEKKAGKQTYADPANELKGEKIKNLPSQ